MSMLVWGCLTPQGGSDISNDFKWELDKIECIMGRSGQPNDHELQFKLPFPYISGKHFSISRGPKNNSNSNNGQEFTAILKDFSSNGTFVNSVLVGKGNSVALSDNDLISIKFRGEDKLILKFNFGNDTKGGVKTPDKGNKVNGKEFVDIQIETLRQENSQLESRLALNLVKLETVMKENSNLLKENKDYLDQLKDKNDHITELQQNILSLETNSAALEARCRNMESAATTQNRVVESLKQSLKQAQEQLDCGTDAVVKVQTLKEELEAKKAQCESKNKLLDEAAINLSNQRQLTEKLESDVISLKHDREELIKQVKVLESQKKHLNEAVKSANETISTYRTENETITSTIASIIEKVQQNGDGVNKAFSKVSEFCNGILSVIGLVNSDSSQLQIMEKLGGLLTTLKGLPTANVDVNDDVLGTQVQLSETFTANGDFHSFATLDHRQPIPQSTNDKFFCTTQQDRNPTIDSNAPTQMQIGTLDYQGEDYTDRQQTVTSPILGYGGDGRAKSADIFVDDKDSQYSDILSHVPQDGGATGSHENNTSSKASGWEYDVSSQVVVNTTVSPSKQENFKSANQLGQQVISSESAHADKSDYLTPPVADVDMTSILSSGSGRKSQQGSARKVKHDLYSDDDYDVSPKKKKTK